MKKKLMFVTYLDEHPEEGLSYVLDLAKVMNEDLTVFLLRKRRFARQAEDLMTSVAFAEANEPEAAREALSGSQKTGEYTDEKLVGIFGKCKESGVGVEVYSSREDAVSAIEEFFRHRNGIDIILFGPNIIDHSKLTRRKLRKLSDSVARPVVTIARQTTTVQN